MAADFVADENSKRISVVFFPNCSFHIFHGVIPCFPYSRNFTYFPLIDLLNRTLGIGESDPPKLVWEKIESGLDFVERKEEVFPCVGRHYIVEIEEFCEEFGAEFAGKPARFFQGVVMVGQGQIEEGLHVLEKSCQQWLQNGSRLRFAACGSMLAAVYSDLTRKARTDRQKQMARHADSRAAVYFQSSIESAQQIGAKGTLARAYRNWGNYYKDKGDIDSFRDFFTESVAYFRLCGADALPKQVENE